MKTFRITGLAMVAAFLVALGGASTASATGLYGIGGKLLTGTPLDFSLKSGTSSNLVTTSGETLDTCTLSTLKGKTLNSSGSRIESSVEEWTWGFCTFPTTTINLGKMDFAHISGTTNATARAVFEMSVTINTIFYGTCVYAVTSGSTLGTLTGNSAGAATLDVNAVMKKTIGSAFACPETAKWTVTYVQTGTPLTLYAEAS